MSKVESLYYLQDIVSIPFGIVMILVGILAARNYLRARGYLRARRRVQQRWFVHASPPTPEETLAAVGMGWTGLALLVAGITHAWLIAWSRPDEAIPEPVDALLWVICILAIVAALASLTAAVVVMIRRARTVRRERRQASE